MTKEPFTPKLRPENRRFEYCVAEGVLRAYLADSVVRGTFRNHLGKREETADQRLIETFINWRRDAESVLKFVKTFGPLENEAVASKSFECSVARFAKVQDELRLLWRAASDFPEWQAKDGSLVFGANSVTFRARTMEAFLWVDLLSSPQDRLRVCKWEECEHPYFITGDLKRRFCTVGCSEEGRRRSLKKWREHNGKSSKTAHASL